jgi:hypothetical protein
MARFNFDRYRQSTHIDKQLFLVLLYQQRVDCNRLSGIVGDQFNAILSAVGMTFHKLLR